MGRDVPWHNGIPRDHGQRSRHDVCGDARSRRERDDRSVLCLRQDAGMAEYA